LSWNSESIQIMWVLLNHIFYIQFENDGPEVEQ